MKYLLWAPCFAAVLAGLLVLCAVDALSLLVLGRRSRLVSLAAALWVGLATDRLYEEEYGT